MRYSTPELSAAIDRVREIDISAGDLRGWADLVHALEQGGRPVDPGVLRALRCGLRGLHETLAGRVEEAHAALDAMRRPSAAP